MSRTVIGLVGGIASGKSTVAALLAEERKALCLDADAIARRVLERPDVQRALARRFPGARGPDGRMDRRKLARRVFSDRRALDDLERLTHPRIRAALERALRRARERTVVIDAALLQETGADGLCDVVVYVACPARTRRRRARARGWTEAEHRAREARQWSCRRKRALADHTVWNGGDPGRTRREVRRMLQRIERG
jgi:dephospho-CoA kinase